MNKWTEAIKHFTSLQKRYATQHNGKQCELVQTAIEALKDAEARERCRYTESEIIYIQDGNTITATERGEPENAIKGDVWIDKNDCSRYEQEMSTEKELLDCPFCGGKAFILSTPNYGIEKPRLFVACCVCRVETPRIARNRKQAIAAWNTRVKPNGGEGK